MKKVLKLPFLLLLPVLVCKAQFTPATNATLLSETLSFVKFNGTYATLTYHPVLDKYYSVRLGSPTYFIETWNAVGGNSIHNDTVGLDSRGIWYNPNTGQIERNCFNTIGWGMIDLDASGNAVKTKTLLFTGMHQPAPQCNGVYDDQTNTVLFNNNGTISIYDRNTATFSGTLVLSGITLAGIINSDDLYRPARI